MTVRIDIKLDFILPPSLAAMEQSYIEFCKYSDESVDRAEILLNSHDEAVGKEIISTEYEDGSPSWKYKIENSIKPGQWKVILFQNNEVIGDIKSSHFSHVCI